MRHKISVSQLKDATTNWSFCLLLEDLCLNTVDVKYLMKESIDLRNQQLSGCQIISLGHSHKLVKKLPNLVKQRASQILFHFQKAQKLKASRKTVDPVKQHSLHPRQFVSRPPSESKFLLDEIQYQ